MAPRVLGSSAGNPLPKGFRLYGPHHAVKAWIGWSLTGLAFAGLVVGIVGQAMLPRPDGGYGWLAAFSPLLLIVCWLFTFNTTRPMLAVGKRGVKVRTESLA